MNKIVVGIDGSEASAEALRWALEQAKLTGASLEVIYAWDPGPLINLGMPPLLDWEPLREAAQALPRKVVRDVAGKTSGVPILTKTLAGTAAEVLVEQSAHADLLVVGSRGLGGLKGMLLGSVGHHCAAHAHCPVVIVRSTRPHPRRVEQRETLHHEQVRPLVGSPRR